jgi:hypothetical protein
LISTPPAGVRVCWTMWMTPAATHTTYCKRLTGCLGVYARPGGDAPNGSTLLPALYDVLGGGSKLVLLLACCNGHQVALRIRQHCSGA